MEKNSEAVETLQAICEGISENRAKELLDASNGSLERAIDIFFHQKADQEQTVVQPNKKKRSPTTDNREGKQARLDSSFSTEIRIESCAAEGSVNAKEKIEVIAIDDSAGDDDNSQIEAKLLNESAEKEVKESIVAGFKSTRKPLMDTTEHRRTSGSDKKSAHHFVSKISFSRTETLKPQLTFQRLSEALQQMADTTKRLVKLDVLQKVITEIISNADKPERAIVLTYALRLVLGLRTSTDQAPLDVSGSAVSKALQTILGVSRTQLSKGYRQYGDLGDSAASYFQKKTFFVTSVRPLSILELYQSLQKIVQTDGRDSKQHILLQLMRSCQTKTELRFLVRLLIGNMRVGANLKTVLAALAAAVRIDHGKDLDIKGAVELVKKTHDICPNLEKIISALLAGGFEQMKKDCCIQLLTPIAPMLAHPIHSLKDVEEVMNVKKNSTVMEYKYDGVRCQAHYDGTRVNLFSRHLLETTSQYPDAAKSFLGAVKEDKNVESFIIDSEIVGVEGEGDQTRLLPFQDLSRRKRKTDDGLGVRVKVFAFDLMYLNGISFVGRPLWERQQIFHEYFKETESYAFVSSRVLPSYDGNKIKEFLEEAVRCGAEGLMVKMLGMSHGEGEKIHETGSLPPAISTTESSPYEAGTRSHNWLKVKRDYVTGYADTIDVVPIGAWYGSGRKAQKSFLSPVLLAVYDEDEDVYRSISRCMSFTDDMYEAMREFYFRGISYPSNVGIEGGDKEGSNSTKADLKMDCVQSVAQEDDSDSDEKNSDIDRAGQSNSFLDDKEMVNCFSTRPTSAFVITNESPPIWFKPLEVFEVAFADMTLSRQHTAAVGLIDDEEGRGVALRFPRFKRRRPDKRPDQATTTFQIAQLFSKQSKQGSSATRSRVGK